MFCGGCGGGGGCAGDVGVEGEGLVEVGAEVSDVVGGAGWEGVVLVVEQLHQGVVGDFAGGGHDVLSSGQRVGRAV